MTTVSVEPLALPPKLKLDSLGYGSAVIALAGSGALFAAHSGSAVRCLRVDIVGGFTVIPKVRGLLRDAEPEGDTRLWLLASHGLHLVDLAADRVIETIRTGLPSYGVRLTRLDADHLIVSVVGGHTATVVSTREGRVTQRLRMPTVDLVLDGRPLILCSFERGVVREVDATWRRIGADRSIPTAIAPCHTGGRIVAVLTDLVPVMPGSELTRPATRGVVGMFERDLRLVLERPIDGIERIDGVASDGTLLGVTRDAVVLIDPGTLDEIGRAPAPGWNPVVGPFGPRAALALAESRSLVPALAVIRW